MKNIHLIPTDKPSRLHKIGNELGLTDKPNSNLLAKQQNIYITNDEEIKEGDWIYDSSENDIIKRSNFPDINRYIKKFCKKIILTTDQDLIKDGVQAIDDEFLEWFVKNPNCESVEIKTFCCQEISKNYCDLRCGKQTYKIIIPKEEPKQEVL